MASVDVSFLLKTSVEVISEKNNTMGIDNEDAGSVDNLVACCNLVTHNGSNKYSAQELMKESLVAVFFTRCLKAKGYFNQDNENNTNEFPKFTDDCIKVAIWIHHLMRVARFNSHEVTEYNDENQTCEHGDTDCCR